jgi:RHS repeat-associated protein
MKRHFHTTVAIALMLLLLAGQLPLAAASRERVVRPEPPKPARRSKKQDLVPQPRPAGESVTKLPDGRTLHLGGESPSGPTTAAEIRDERTGAVTRLSESFRFARAWHTATVLPDGLVFIFGGMGSKGEVLSGPELFDPENNSFQVLPANALKARAYHTATLLTDGRLLLAGGVDVSNKSSNRLETWDQENKTARVLNTQLKSGRRKAQASLQADGTVFISSGSDNTETLVAGSEIYDPAANVLTWIPTSNPNSDEAIARIAFSSPADGSVDVDPKTRIAIRFSQPLQSDSVNRTTVRLSGPSGDVPSRVVATENGRLTFVTPLAPLAGDSSYNVALDGPITARQQKLEFATFGFKTKAGEDCAPGQPCAGETQIFDADTWVPSNNGNGKGSWTSGRREVAPDLPPLEAAAGETALAGRVYALSGNPLHNVSLQIGERITRTDNTGRFLLSGIASGRQTLTIQGHTAGKSGKQYGTFDVLVDVVAGKTTALSYKIWLPVLDEQNAVTLPIPTHRELGVTTPNIPGMEVRVPSNSVLRMPAGAHHSHGLTRRELTSVSITPVPADRTPFPLPQGINDGLVFTLQLHGARVEGPKGEKRPGLRVVYPNYLNYPAGHRVEFWNYEPAGTGWYKYGHGTVTADRSQVIPDPGVELQNMHCLSMMVTFLFPPSWPLVFAMDGDPVDLASGLFVYNKTDLLLPDVHPLQLKRTYRQSDSVERPFGKGMTTGYEMFVGGNTASWGAIILPDGGRVLFDRIGPQVWPYTYECTTSPTKFFKATMTFIPGVGPNGAWEVKLKDGTIYQFGIKALQGDIFGVHVSTNALYSVQDRFGNKTTITRDSDLRMTRITSPNGRWIQFSYSDNSKRIAQATDNIGRTIGYTYDANGRLWKVTDAKGGITEYLYDASDRMLTVKNPRNIVYLTNVYDAASGRITRQTLADDGEYQFVYTVDAQGKVTRTDVTDPRDHIRRTTFNTNGYPTSDILALGTPLQQTYTYEYQAASNFVTSMVDPLNRRTAMTYDTKGNMTSITRMAGTDDAVSASLTYEPAFNQVETMTDPLNHTTTYDYDEDGLLESVTDPLNKEITYTYNSAGQVLTATDPLDRTVQYEYDSGDLVSMTDPLNRTITRYVDAAGRVTRITNALGQATRYEFDSHNHPTQGTDAKGDVSAMSHDPNGNVLSLTDARNNVTSYVYDDMDRVTTFRDPLLHDETYQYDENGNVSQVTDRKGQITTFTYDALDRLSQITYHDTSTTTYTYDSVDRVTQIVDSLAGTVTCGYDTLDRLTSKTTPQGTINYTYDDAGRLTSMTVDGQPTVNYTYDNGDRLTQVTQGTATATMAYDDIGRRTSLTLPNNVVTEYVYDNASHLTSLTYKHNGNTLGDLTYEYDARGNVTRTGGSFARSILPQPVTSATYNAANQQLTFGSKTFTYDLNGNLTGDGTSSYTWDTRDQLTQVNGPEANASFGYGPIGGRTNSTVNGNTTSYLRNGGNVVQQQSSQTGTTNILSGGPGETLSRSDSSGVYSSLFDGVGSALASTNASGAIQGEYSYGAFGEAASSGLTPDNSSEYVGSESDGTGLQYKGDSYYSPEQQRFINEGSGANSYSFAGNNPISTPKPAGPKSPFRDPFSVDSVYGNGGANTFNDLMLGDKFAEWSWIWADRCRPMMERIFAGWKIYGVGAVMAGGGAIVRGLAGAAGGLIRGVGGSLMKRLGSGGGKKVINLAGEGEVAGAVNVNGKWITETGWRTSRNSSIGLRDLQGAGHEFVIADNAALPFADKSINTVITNNVRLDASSHLGAYPQTSEIWRVLSDSGTWIHNGVTMVRP